MKMTKESKAATIANLNLLISLFELVPEGTWAHFIENGDYVVLHLQANTEREVRKLQRVYPGIWKVAGVRLRWTIYELDLGSTVKIQIYGYEEASQDKPGDDNYNAEC